MQTYKTINSQAESLYKEKGSKFFAFAYPVKNEEEIANNLDLLKKRFHDASHHCFAWILGTDGSKWRSNDDGEPAHTAGNPILGQIRSRKLTNILVVIVRYFGGTKLGISGLIHAYKYSASEVIVKAGINTLLITKPISITYGYESTSEVLRIVDELNIKIINQEYEQKCSLDGEIDVDKMLEFDQRIELMREMGVDIKVETPGQHS